ncbi:MAG: N-6 DNA methylase [Acidobacteriota bacterium]|nr:N-6 DNA methylase [Acidobacteriota bacterium]
MNEQRNREEVVNTQLAIFISDLGVAADAETIHFHGRQRPDVLFDLRGLRVIIEGKFSDHANAQQIVLEDARRRVQSGIAHLATAVVYPKPLRNTPTAGILETLGVSKLKYLIISEAGESDWYEGDPASLMDALRQAQESLAKDDIVEKTARSLSIQLEGVAMLWMGRRGPCDRLSDILGFAPPKSETKTKAQERRETAAKVSALVLANAFIFQEQLSRTDARVSSLRKLEKEDDLVGATAKHWNWIWKNINYVPIFQLGENVLLELPPEPQTDRATRALLAEALSICAHQAALRHDLMGRIYHWLLHEAKYLGTYYTSVSAATLLLKLAIAEKWEQDLSDFQQLADFKVADLACGTGTLLMASAQAITDAFIRKRAESELPLTEKDLTLLHRTLMQNVIYGYDVLPSAVHLTASTLALLAPDVAFVRMGLFVMPLGIDHGIARLGSLDFLSTNVVRTQIALDYSQLETVRTGAGFSYLTNAELPMLDLCVMNPPFVRSVGGNLLFGSLPDERGMMQKELKLRVGQLGASSTAGLGSVFVALADRWLKPKGRLAFVLPAALASGEAWASTRELLANRYHLETVISSHDSSRPNFSENTDLSELLFIARKLEPKEKPGRTTYINLWQNPRTTHESIDLEYRLTRGDASGATCTVEGEGISTIRRFSKKLGEKFSMPAAKGKENWTGALFAQTELLRVFWGLQFGQLRLPAADVCDIPLCELGLLGELGYDRRDIHDAFTVSKDDWSPYPAFWSHDSKKVKTIAQTPNANLLARTKAAEGRRLKSAKDVWAKAGRILLVERLWPVTHRVLAVRFDNKALGNTWWAFNAESLTEKQEKALLLWLNSSLSLLLYFGHRVVTRSAWMQMKKPAWKSMPVLDVRSLSSKQLTALAKQYDALSVQGLAALAQLKTDPVRVKIDAAISRALGTPDLAPVRELLEREPGLSALDVSPKGKSVDEDDEE